MTTTGLLLELLVGSYRRLSGMVTVYDNGSSFYADGGKLRQWFVFLRRWRQCGMVTVYDNGSSFMPMVENYDNGSSFYADGGIAQLL